MGFCSNCGNKLEEGSIYCSYCGTKVIDEMLHGEEDYTQSSPENIQNHNVGQNPDKYQAPNMDQSSSGYQDQNSYQSPNTYQNSTEDQKPSTYQNPDAYQNHYANQNSNAYQDPNANQTQYGYSHTTFNPYMNNNSTRKGKKNGLIIGIAAAVITLIALLAVIVTLIAFRTPDYERPLKNMTNALEDGNYQKLINCYPDFMQGTIEGMMDYYGDPEDAMDEMMDQFEESYGDGIKITYKIKEKDKLFQSDLDAMEDNIENTYNERVSIEDGYKLGVDIIIEGDDDNETEDTTINVIKIDGKWYLLDNSMNW